MRYIHNYLDYIKIVTTEVARPCDDDERGAHSNKKVRCGHTRENNMREAKPKVKRCV